MLKPVLRSRIIIIWLQSPVKTLALAPILLNGKKLKKKVL
jgi:hypothetical protein